MRLRNERLTTGYLFTVFRDSSDRANNSSLLFLVEGARDVEALGRIEKACQVHPSEHTWKPVADQAMLRTVDRDVVPGNVYRIEARELSGLDEKQVSDVLAQPLARLLDNERELFPAASGAVGAPARGVHLLDRVEDVCAIVERIQTGQHVEVVGPRRFGKTSVLLRLEEKLAAPYAPLFVDMQQANTLNGFSARVRRRVSGSRAREAAEDVERKGWQNVLREALIELGTKQGRTPVLLLDEVVYFLCELGTADQKKSERGRVDAARGFVDGINAAIQASGCRLVLAGSVALETYLRELRAEEILAGIEGLQVHYFAPLSPSCNRTLMRQILIGSRLVPEPADLQWLAENLDLSLPFPALRFLVQVETRVAQGGSLAPAGLARELDRFLDDTETFDDLEEHLNRCPEGESASRDRLSKTLDQIVHSHDQGIPEAEVRRLVGDNNYLWLFNIWPLCIRDGKVHPASPLWTRWWRSRA